MIPYYLAMFRIHGPFLFGATDKLTTVTERVNELPEIIVLRLRNMTAIDATGLEAIEDLAKKVRAANRELILCGAREQPAALMMQAHMDRHVGKNNICSSVDSALDRAAQLHQQRQGTV